MARVPASGPDLRMTVTFRLPVNHNRLNELLAEDTGMTGPWRSLLLAAAFVLAADMAVAQTILVRNAPQGATVELQFNGVAMGSASTKPGSGTKFVLPPSAQAAKPERDVRIWIDMCDTLRRVMVFEVGQWPAPKEQVCERREVPGVFWGQRITTFVVDLGGTSPSVWLRQGAVPVQWLGQGPTAGPSGPRMQPPAGVSIGLGGGSTSFSNTGTTQCGNVSPCTGNSGRLTYMGSVTLWVVPFLGIDVSYIKPAVMKLHGEPAGAVFDTHYDAQIYRVAVKAGLPTGRFRFYGIVGANYVKTALTTTETVAARTVTVDGITQTIAGGTQDFALKTAGWGFLIGAGVEVWASRRFAFFAEYNSASLRGKSTNGEIGRTSENGAAILGGIRFKLTK